MDKGMTEASSVLPFDVPSLAQGGPVPLFPAAIRTRAAGWGYSALSSGYVNISKISAFGKRFPQFVKNSSILRVPLRSRKAYVERLGSTV